ncbi:dermonecrotic toxin domain-containing protein, partial [Pseudomonas reidholzensis]
MQTAVQSPTPTPGITPEAITDQFIEAQLPDWLQRTAEDIQALRSCFNAHLESHRLLAEATRELVSPQRFAEQQFTSLLAERVPGQRLQALEWLDARQVPSSIISTPSLEVQHRRFPALLRLMQGFSSGYEFFKDSGLVLKGSARVLPGGGSSFVDRCRALDVGKQYQQRLETLLAPATQALMANHQQAAFALACELAVLHSRITPAEHVALKRLSAAAGNAAAQTLHAYPGTLQLLGCTLTNGLKIQLRDAQGEHKGVILYLPGDGAESLRRFRSDEQASEFLLGQLREAEGQRRFAERVAMSQRSTFVTTLALRLQDDRPDLALKGAVVSGEVFAALAAQQVSRVKDDGRRLLVANADADRSASEHLLAAWQGVGLEVLGLAGLIVPGVGVLLLGQTLLQTLGEVYEGAVDWAQGHQHEALQHMLGVAETVAVTAATIAGTAGIVQGARLFTRSAFVDGLQPISRAPSASRLWNPDLTCYASEPGDAVLQDNGLYADDERQWLRQGDRYYEVRQAQQGGWQLRHPRRANAYGPLLDFNGERCWRLRSERPLEWHDRAEMLNRLWPQEPPVNDQQAEQILRMAGVDLDELRGVLVENRPAPVNLRDSLRRFEADQKISRLFAALCRPQGTIDDPQIRAWCQQLPAMRGLSDAAQASTLVEQRYQVQGDLLDYLSKAPPREDALLALVQRDFPGLPDAYAQEALVGIDPALRQSAELESRVPRLIAHKARALLTLARTNRAIEGLFLPAAYSDGTGELVLALLPRLDHWPSSINLELSEASGRRIAILNPQAPAEHTTTLVRRKGQFALYDAEGQALDTELAAPGGIFQAVLATLPEADRQTLKLTAEDPAEQLRLALIQHLPQSRSAVLSRLGWSNATPWFNPGTRLADGRVGYTLGGAQSRRANAMRTVRDRIRALYPGFSDGQVQHFLDELLREGDSVFETLLFHESNYARLDRALAQWQGDARRGPLRVDREAFANRLRGAWRYEGEPVAHADSARSGRRLMMPHLHVGALPSLPDDIDFGHVYELIMPRMNLSTVPANFLRAFDAVQTLRLSNNLLTALPPGIVHLTDLRVLDLSSNSIRLGPAALDSLSTLTRLDRLVVSRNPLGSLDLNFEQMTSLRGLYATNCNLRSMPQGLERSRQLAFADLRFNAITQIPAELAAMPSSFLGRVMIEGNPVASLPADPARVHEVVAPAVVPQWLAIGNEPARQARTALWGRLRR